MVIVAVVGADDRDEAILSEASSLSKAFDEPVHVVHVMTSDEFVDIERENIEETGKPIERDTVDQNVRRIAAEIAADLTVPSRAVGLVGSVAKNTVQYADEQDARYIVVGLRKRSPTGKAVFGSAAQSIMLNAHCPVVSTLRAP